MYLYVIKHNFFFLLLYLNINIFIYFFFLFFSYKVINSLFFFSVNMNLYIVSVDLINGLYPIILDVLSLIAIFSGVLVITTKNPIVSVLFLISLFLVIAVYLILI